MIKRRERKALEKTGEEEFVSSQKVCHSKMWNDMLKKTFKCIGWYSSTIVLLYKPSILFLFKQQLFN